MSLLDALQQILTHLGFQVTVQGFLILFGLAFVRLLAVIALAPFFGGATVPTQAKVGLAAITAAILYPAITAGVQTGEVTTLLFVGLLLKEAFIGAALGIVAQLFFYAVQVAGTIIDTQRGMNQFSFFSPQLAGNVSILGQLKFQAALVLFLSLDGHLMFIRGLQASFVTLPLLSFPGFRAGFIGLCEQVIRVSAAIFSTALRLSAPVLLTLFLLDLAFAAVAKVAPQIHVHFESQTAKSLVGLAMVFLTVALVMGLWQSYLLRLIQEIQTL
ncbi:MAG: flagellar biosynthetic protein FliR, partial [Acidobacteriales bacterium]|nr:flagellar biosynthetic protein FliR [Terriglobales bacterium]